MCIRDRSERDLLPSQEGGALRAPEPEVVGHPGSRLQQCSVRQLVLHLPQLIAAVRLTEGHQLLLRSEAAEYNQGLLSIHSLAHLFAVVMNK